MAARQGLRSLLLHRSSALPSKHPVSLLKKAFSSKSAPHEDIEETIKWRNVTIVGYVVCTALTIYNFTGGHEVHEERKPYSYLRIRNKEFPWGPDGLFEYPPHEHEHA